MDQWHKTGCVLCAQNCGLEILVENHRMVKVRPDKSNLRSQGYACRKGLSVIYHQYPEDRITQPLKRVGEEFVPVSWEQATSEIAEKMRRLVDSHGPRAGLYGGQRQGGHSKVRSDFPYCVPWGPVFLQLRRTGIFPAIRWLFGRMLGKQYNVAVADEDASEMLGGGGWNGMESHQMPRAPKVLTEFSKDPNRVLVIIDTRKSETAAIADMHLPVRPGTDALLIKAIISIIIDHQWENRQYINDHVEGWEKIRPWFENFDARAAIETCELNYDDVLTLCRLMTTKRWCLHPDLGIYMGRRSTLNSYLMNILGAICGIFCVRGGNVIPAWSCPWDITRTSGTQKPGAP
jgi:anaerobic selenocysteine-containing dehydrogenase